MSAKCEINDFGRECCRCHKFLPWHNYAVDKAGTRGRKGSCNECLKQIRLERKQKQKVVEAEETVTTMHDFLIKRTHLKGAA